MKENSNPKKGSILREGAITCTNQLGLLRRKPDLEGNQPMLLADLAEEMGLPSTRIQSSVSAEAIMVSEQQIYLFKLQIGATLICWLTNPHDPAIQSMLQSWTNARHMFVSVITRHGVLIRTRPVIGSVQPIDPDAMTEDTDHFERFFSTATQAVASGLIKTRATSDIDSVKKIRKLRIFVIGHDANAASAKQLL